VWSGLVEVTDILVQDVAQVPLTQDQQVIQALATHAAQGIPAVSVTVARDITEHARPPRAVFVPFMMGHHFGVPFHRALQRRIIVAALDRLETVERSGDIHDLPVTRARARREGREIERGLEKEQETASAPTTGEQGGSERWL